MTVNPAWSEAQRSNTPANRVTFLHRIHRFDPCSHIGNLLACPGEDDQAGHSAGLLAAKPGCRRTIEILVPRG